MNILRCAAIAAILSITTAGAADVPPSEASIRELLKVTNVRSLLDQMLPQIDSMLKDAMEQALRGQRLSDAKKDALGRMTERINGLIKEELDWAKLEPMYIGIYKESFTQEEVDGMMAFYGTPAGQALIKKMPVVMQKSMGATQQMMGPMMQKLQVIQTEFMGELQALEKKEGDPARPGNSRSGDAKP